MEYTTVTKDVEFVPVWEGNDEREDDERIVFTLRYLTDAQLAKCYTLGIDKGGDQTVSPKYELLAKYGIADIKNLTVDEVEIKTAQQFGGLSGFSRLYMEIGTQILIMNPRQDLKN